VFGRNANPNEPSYALTPLEDPRQAFRLKASSGYETNRTMLWFDPFSILR
jgi:hypothetical protein